MDKLFPYACDELCFEFSESSDTMSFAVSCETVCGSGCPYCVYKDVPYTEEMFST